MSKVSGYPFIKKMEACINKIKKETLNECLELLTPSQLEKFDRIYPNYKYASLIDSEKFQSALRVCQTTIEHNIENNQFQRIR